MFKKLKQKVKDWRDKHMDYKIVGEYYDTPDGVHYTKKYNRKWYFKKK